MKVEFSDNGLLAILGAAIVVFIVGIIALCVTISSVSNCACQHTSECQVESTFE